MFCKHCGAEMADEAKFCPKCGANKETGEKLVSDVLQQLKNMDKEKVGQELKGNASTAVDVAAAHIKQAWNEKNEGSELQHKMGIGASVLLATSAFLPFVSMFGQSRSIFEGSAKAAAVPVALGCLGIYLISQNKYKSLLYASSIIIGEVALLYYKVNSLLEQAGAAAGPWGQLGLGIGKSVLKEALSYGAYALILGVIGTFVAGILRYDEEGKSVLHTPSDYFNEYMRWLKDTGSCAGLSLQNWAWVVGGIVAIYIYITKF